MVKETSKICLILPSLNVGGMERVMLELANYFITKKGVETHLIIMVKHNHFYPAPASVILHEPKFVFNKTLRFLNTLKTLLFVRRQIKAIKPQSVLTFGEMYNSFVLLASWGLDTKVFVSDRSKPDKKWGRFHEFLRIKLYSGAYGIISQTHFSKNFLSKLINHPNIRVIPNPVTRKSDDQSPRKNIILSVGRLIGSKQIDVLLTIFSGIQYHDWKLWIVGDGPRRAMLEKTADQLGISDRVIFFGNQKDIGNFYSQAKIFAFTSVSEGFPNVLLEAMSSGLPCVSFDCVAGPADIIQDGVNGFLVKELDKEGFREKLMLLINDSKLLEECSANAILKMKNYHIDRIGEMYYKFLTS